MGENTVCGGLAVRGVLVQAPAEDEHVAAYAGAAGEREVAAEHQNVAADIAIKENMAGEHPNAAGGVSIHLGGAQKAAHVMNRLVRCNHNIPAKVAHAWRQNQSANHQAP